MAEKVSSSLEIIESIYKNLDKIYRKIEKEENEKGFKVRGPVWLREQLLATEKETSDLLNDCEDYYG